MRFHEPYWGNKCKKGPTWWVQCISRLPRQRNRSTHFGIIPDPYWSNKLKRSVWSTGADPYVKISWKMHLKNWQELIGPLTQPITCNGCFPLPKERLITFLKFKKQGLRESFCTPKVAHGVKWFSTNGDIPCEKCNIIVWGFQHPSNLCSYLCDLCFSKEGWYV